MAARAIARVEKPSGSRPQTIDVELINELLLLETCADSTQTLMATLSGLAPPSPPNKQTQIPDRAYDNRRHDGFFHWRSI